jgi:tRNA-specific 2-thiouridylase
MSGGVDSSVAAYLLQKRGYEAVGVHLRCWNEGGCDMREAEDARRVAEHLSIPFYVFDMEDEYRERVVKYMIRGYESGITPNPDVACNKEIKFGLFLKRALEMGANYVATGHYVKLKTKNLELKTLFQAEDRNKDQSYFLWALTQEQLKHCLFPIGGYLKEEVRRIAKSAGLPTAEKKDSQGICFVGKIALADFLARYIPEKEGAVVNTSGEKIGEHRGAQFYTIGQRHTKANFQFPRPNFQKPRKPYYIARKDITANTITVVEGADSPELYSREIRLTDVNFVQPLETGNSGLGISVLARVRYRQPLSRAVLKGNALTFNRPQKFVAPGQSAVFYARDGEVLGGGIIAEAEY